MKSVKIGYILGMVVGLGCMSAAMAENQPSALQQATDKVGQVVEQGQAKMEEVGNQIKDKAGQVVEQGQAKMEEVSNQLKDKANELAGNVENSAKAKELTTGLLRWIYVIAEALSFSAFYWLSFALMIAGVVSWTGQLVIGKLVVASNGAFDIKEIISDAAVLAISVFGLVLTTQAAAQNSTFTQSAVMVLSATVVGAIFGFMLYLWGQEQEVKAAKGSK